MTQDTKLQQLVINKLTTAQYQAALNAGTIDPNQLYMTTDSQTLRDVTVGGSSIVSNNTAALGTMALETASNYSTKAVADTLYAQKALETTVAGKLDKISTASKVYGTDVNGNQTSYDITSFGNVDDVKVGTTSVVANKIATLGTMAGQPTTNYYTKTEIDGKLSAGMHYKGTVASYSNLPSSDNQVGDLYNVTDTGSNYAWDGTAWDKMSENIDLSNVVPNTRTINGKELSTNITLSASDVGALPSSTVIPTVDQTYDGTSTNAQSGVAIAGAKFIQNNSNYLGVMILGTDNSSGSNANIAIGYSSSVNGANSNIAIGSMSSATEGGVAIGNSATVSGHWNIALGNGANATSGIQIGPGTATGNSLWIGGLGHYSRNYKLLDSDGKIPDDRLNTTIARTSQIPSASDLLPSQSGNSGKFLTTDGSSASWATITQPSIATTSVAGLVKPDGTSITVDANGVISSAADVEIDEETITKNSSDELQTVAIVNPNTNNNAISPLKIWNGTERQWINGEATVWNYWQTDVQAMWSNGGNLISSNNWDIAFGNNKFVIVGENTTETAYSTDGGATWTAGGNLPNATSSWSHITYGNGIFVAISYGSASAAYSTDGGATWTGAELPSSSTWESLAYGDGNFVTISRDRKTAYSTDGGATWTAGGNLPTGDWVAVAYGDGKFISCKADGIGTQYSTDGGATWTAGGNLPTGTSCWFISYNDGKFITIMQNSNKSAYSTDGGATWNPTTMPSSERWMSMTYGNNKFVAITWENNKSAIFSVTYDKCYTLDSTPTTSSQVYSAPEITSAKTITSVGSGTITLSDNLVYNSTPTGNQNTYRTLGDAHPDWLCNINNIGVKIGNTIIATAGGTDVEALTDSEIEELWEE